MPCITRAILFLYYYYYYYIHILTDYTSLENILPCGCTLSLSKGRYEKKQLKHCSLLSNRTYCTLTFAYMDQLYIAILQSRFNSAHYS